MNTTKRQLEVELCPQCGKQYPAGAGTCPADGAQLMVQAADPLIGTRLPRNYLIVEKLGRGAMSVVYRGIYEPLGQEVAIKLLKSHLVSDLQSFKRFQQEAKTAGALEHPNIVAIFDFGVTDQGVPYLIMELLHGQSLFQMIHAQKELNLDAALRIFMQSADALSYTHRHGVIHRDVKPSNIIIERDSGKGQRVKIVDFGIAKLQNYEGNPAANLTHAGEVFGTPLYISPEQAMGRPLDGRADIYSLGCVMYEAIAGHPPFAGRTALDVIRLQCTGLPEPLDNCRPPGELPPRLVSAVHRCINKAPDARYSSMDELLFDLDQASIEYKSRQDIARKQSDSTGFRQLRRPVKMTVQNEADSWPAAAKTMLNPLSLAHLASQAANAQSWLRLMPSSTAGPVSGKFKAVQNVKSATKRSATPTKSQSDSSSAKAEDRKVQPAKVVSARLVLLGHCLLASTGGCLSGLLILLLMHSGTAVHGRSVLLSPPPAEAPLSAIKDKQVAQAREQAMSLLDAGKPALAEEKITKALSQAEDKHETLAAGLLQADLCLIDIEMKKFKDAYDAGDAAVKVLSAQPGVSKKDLSLSLRGQGIACVHLGMLSQAEALLKLSCQLDKDVYGQRDERFAIGLGRLAKVLEAEKKYDEAEAYFRQALSVSESCHKARDPHLPNRMTALATFLRTRHRISEAKALERKARRLASKEGIRRNLNAD